MYIEGATLKDIQEKLDVPFRTLQTWQRRYEWDIYANAADVGNGLRQNTPDGEARALIISRLLKKAEQSAERYLEVSRILGQMCVEVLQKSYKNGEFRKEGGKRHAESQYIKAWAAIARLGVTIANDAVPNMSEEIAQRIMTELEKREDSEYAIVKKAVETTHTRRIQSPQNK